MDDELTLEEIEAITAITAPKGKYSKPVEERLAYAGWEQNGPLRWTEIERQCTHQLDAETRRIACRAPTYLKVNGVPRCSVHALKELNEIAVRLEKQLGTE